MWAVIIVVAILLALWGYFLYCWDKAHPDIDGGYQWHVKKEDKEDTKMLSPEDMMLQGWCDDCDQDPTECMLRGKCKGAEMNEFNLENDDAD